MVVVLHRNAGRIHVEALLECAPGFPPPPRASFFPCTQQSIPFLGAKGISEWSSFSCSPALQKQEHEAAAELVTLLRRYLENLKRIQFLVNLPELEELLDIYLELKHQMLDAVCVHGIFQALHHHVVH